MNLKKISAEIPQEQETQVIQYVKDIKSLLPFLVGLNSKDRRRLAKLSRAWENFAWHDSLILLLFIFFQAFFPVSWSAAHVHNSHY
jgi:hypothetical protein